jgi:hypothetical protein
MPAPKRYNGHHCYNCWNVALWIANDESLYRFALDCKREARTITEAAAMMLESLPETTPDGARYGLKAVRSAISDLE